MKVVSVHNFGSGCSDLDIGEEIRNGIIAVVWPENSDSFSINPTRKGNGVRPIKNRFMNHISKHGYDVNEWQNPYRFDAFHEKNKIAIETSGRSIDPTFCEQFGLGGLPGARPYVRVLNN